ncbi:MAG: Ig-like domain-containing protein [Dysgonamonadaceae bacterium]|jgi:hypothetical protein|nr:Ig-like domain-containing protein [Dysgonamonadaceae bacterium]
MGRRRDGGGSITRLSEYYCYGAYTTFTVTEQQVRYTPITLITFTLPQDNLIFLNTPDVALVPRVYPDDATFKTGLWTSSNPAIAEISANGTITAKTPGQVTITFISDEVEFRHANAQPSNDEVLIKSFDIYVAAEYPKMWIPASSDRGGFESWAYSAPRLYLSQNFYASGWEVNGTATAVVFHSDSTQYGSITGDFEITGDMLFLNYVNYTIPFNERTFPKIPTTDTVIVAGKTGNIWADPYRIAISIPFTQNVGDRVLNYVLSDTFNLHVAMPPQSQPVVVKQIKEMPAETTSPDTLELQYEVKYLTKNASGDGIGFKLYWTSKRTYTDFNVAPITKDGKYTADGEFNYVDNADVGNYYFTNGIDFVDRYDIADGSPDWLELIDRGSYYDAIVTIKHALPKPIGLLSAPENREYYELYETTFFAENTTGALVHDAALNKNVVSLTSIPLGQRSTTKVFMQRDMSMVKSLSKYAHGDTDTPNLELEAWYPNDEDGYSLDSITPLIEAGNRTGNYTALDQYMKGNAMRTLGFYAPPGWGKLHVGILENGDTTWFDINQNEKLFAFYPCGGFNTSTIVVKYPQLNEVIALSYFNEDDIIGKIYPLEFGYGYAKQQPISTKYPLHITYTKNFTRVEGTAKWVCDTVSIVLPAGRPSNRYIIYEPVGIMGKITYTQYDTEHQATLTGAVEVEKSKTLGAGSPIRGVLSRYRKEFMPNFDFVKCYNTAADFIKVFLVDEKGNKITKNAHINYIAQENVSDEAVVRREYNYGKQASSYKSYWFPTSNPSRTPLTALYYFLIGAGLPDTDFSSTGYYEEKGAWVDLGVWDPDVIVNYESYVAESITLRGEDAVEIVRQLMKENAAQNPYEWGGEWFPQPEIFTTTYRGDCVEGTAGKIPASVYDTYFPLPVIRVNFTGSAEPQELWAYDVPGEGGATRRSAHYLMEVVADGYYPKIVSFDANPAAGDVLKDGLKVILEDTIGDGEAPLSKPELSLWYERYEPTENNPNWIKENTGYLRLTNDMFPIQTEYTRSIQDRKDLSEVGSNTVVTFQRDLDQQNAVLNITCLSTTKERPDYEDWPNELGKLYYERTLSGFGEDRYGYLVTSVIHPDGFENTYRSYSYPLNIIEYGLDENGKVIPEKIKYPTLITNTNIVVSNEYGYYWTDRHSQVVLNLPGFLNDEIKPSKVKEAVWDEVTDKVGKTLDVDQFDFKNMIEAARVSASDNEGQNVNLDQARQDPGLNLNFTLPDPLDFTFNVEQVGNRFNIRGVASVNLLNSIPGVAQINAIGDIANHVSEFNAAFQAVKQAAQSGGSRENTANAAIKRSRTPAGYGWGLSAGAQAFLGFRAFLEGYGEYDPLSRKFDFGLSNGGVLFEASAAAFVGVSFPIAYVDVGFGGEVIASVAVGAPSEEDWKKKVNDAKFDMTLETTVHLYGYVYFGVRINMGFFKLDLEVGADADFLNKNKFILKPYLGEKNMLVSGGYIHTSALAYLWSQGEVLFGLIKWDKYNKVFDVDYWKFYPDDSKNPYWSLKSNKVSRLRSVASDYRRNTVALPNTVITDVVENATPRYFGDGNSILFNNLKTATNHNDDRLSIFSSGSAADLLPTAKMPQFAFDVASSASGATVVAYEQMSDSITPKSDNVSDTTYIKSVANNADVYASVKVGDAWQTTRLSDNNTETLGKVVDMQPKTAISPDGKTAAVVWKSGFMEIDKEHGPIISGSLLMSRYKNETWSDPITLMSTDYLSGFSLAIDGDSVVVAAARIIPSTSEDNPEETKLTSKVRLISVSAKDSIAFFETNREGSDPQIARVGDKYYVSYLTYRTTNDTVPTTDIYMLAVQKNGEVIDSLSGFANAGVPYDYKLIGDNNAKSISDLGIIYNATHQVEASADEPAKEYVLLAGKFGEKDGIFYISNPDTVLTLPADGDQSLRNFDGYKQGNSMKTAAVVANTMLGGIVVEKTTEFENKINCLWESYYLPDIKNGEPFSVEFYVANAGYLPVTSLAVSMNGEDSTVYEKLVMPGITALIKGSYTVPWVNADPVPYSITATFDDGSTYTYTGSIDLTSYQMTVKLLSLNNTDTKNSALLEIVNNSTSPLTKQHEVTVGIYEDRFGEKLYPGIAMQTIPASEFYAMDDKGDTIYTAPTLAFDLPIVEETTSVFAFAKVKKKNLLRSATGVKEEIVDVEQTDRTYASIQLFPTPIRTETGTRIARPVKPKVKEEGLTVYVRDESAVVVGPLKQTIRVYTVAGVLLKAIEPNPEDKETVIPLPKGVYLITSGGKTGKVII